MRYKQLYNVQPTLITKKKRETQTTTNCSKIKLQNFYILKLSYITFEFCAL